MSQTTDNFPTKYYSARQLSPFVGNIQILESSFCRALSSNGVNWQIQASCETHQQSWGISGEKYIPRRYVLYGSWDKESGFSSLPLDPMLDVPDMEHIEKHIINALQNIEQLPFPQTDYYECWLLDSITQKPLALIASTTDEFIIPHIQIQRWQALPQHNREDISKAAFTIDDINRLEEHINTHSSSHCWYLRRPDKPIMAFGSR